MRPELAVKLSKILTMNDCRRNGLALGLILAVIAQLIPATSASRNEEPWPMLLAGDPAGVDPSVVLLRQRASDSLQRLMQGADAAAQSL
jgi:hypothetical protein